MAQATNTVVDGVVRVHGTVVPATHWSVEVNAYSISSSLDATIATASARSFAKLPDLFALGQKVRPLPITIDLGLGADALPQNRLPLESGYVDEISRNHGERIVMLSGRGSASIFQDVQITAPLLRNARGSDLIARIFAKRGIPLSVSSGSSQYAGKTVEGQTFDQTMRGRSEWDVMQAIAVADGYRLTLHNRRGRYGPYGLNDPLLHAQWGRSGGDVRLVDLDVKQSPGKSHNIHVIARSFQPRSKHSVSVSYGNKGKDGEGFQVSVKAGLTRSQLQVLVQKIYEDIAKREFIATMVLVPNAKLLETVSQHGANFSIALGGDVWPSEALTYGVRQIRFEFSPGGRGLPLLAHVVAGNLNPIQAGGFLS